jgi:hypothetical protein
MKSYGSENNTPTGSRYGESRKALQTGKRCEQKDDYESSGKITLDSAILASSNSSHLLEGFSVRSYDQSVTPQRMWTGTSDTLTPFQPPGPNIYPKQKSSLGTDQIVWCTE